MEREFTQINAESEHIDTVLSVSNSLFKVSDFIKFIKEVFEGIGTYKIEEKLVNRGGISLNHGNQKWYHQGVDCELLKPGTKGWQKGKLRIKIIIEFSPDEPAIEEISVNHQVNTSKVESPLDDIRRAMNQNT